MAQKRALSALVAAFVLLASSRFARAQEGAGAVTPIEGPQTPVVEPLPEIAPPAAPPAAQPLLALSQHEPQMIHEERSGLKFAGQLTFGLSYGVAVLASLLVLVGQPSDPESGACSTCAVIGASLAIPVFGPLVAYTQVNKGGNPGPLLLTTGIWSGVQAAGVAMIVAGLTGHDVPREPEEPTVTVRHTKISVVPSVTPERAMLSLGSPW
jgi:hypothetical protein